MQKYKTVKLLDGRKKSIKLIIRRLCLSEKRHFQVSSNVICSLSGILIDIRFNFTSLNTK